MDSCENVLLKINEQTIKETTKCSKNFECLKDENSSCMGKVVSCVSGEVHFVDCTESCRFKIRFGCSQFCSCPTRKVIFNKFRK